MKLRQNVRQPNYETLFAKSNKNALYGLPTTNEKPQITPQIYNSGTSPVVIHLNTTSPVKVLSGTIHDRWAEKEMAYDGQQGLDRPN
jgi:hypothetical protein